LRQSQRAQRMDTPRSLAGGDGEEGHPRLRAELPLGRLPGGRRLAFMMLDADVAAVSPSSVYRVLKQAGRIERFNGSPSRKGTSFVQPLEPHEHWHVDISYLNICGTFYYLCSVLDGLSRFIVHWEIHESMTEAR